MADVRIGIVGLGFGTAHVGTTANIDGVRVAAVADNAPVRGRNVSVAEFAASIGAEGFDDGVRMVREADIDAVDLVVAPKWREPLLQAAAQRGLPVLMEKPMANSLAQAERFASIVRDAGIPFMMEYPLRFHPATQRAKELLDDGPLGKPLSLTAELQTSWNPPPGHWTWDDDVEGGWFTECGCHILDTVCFLAGTPTRVFGLGASFFGHGSGVDSAVLAVDFANGSHAVVNGGGIATDAFNVPMYVKVYAEKGEMLLSGSFWVYDRVTWALKGRGEELHVEEIPGPPRMELLRQSMTQFARLVRGEIASPCTADDGLVVQRLIASMAKSLGTGQAETC